MEDPELHAKLSCGVVADMKNRRVVINFENPVRSIAMSPDEAAIFAERIHKAGRHFAVVTKMKASS